MFPPLSALAILSASAWCVLTFGRGSFWREPGARFSDEHRIDPLTTQEEAGIHVAAVIPARNEADVVAHSLPSLVDQRYDGRIGITLVDDHSGDGTAVVARRECLLLEHAGRLKIISARPLEPGWTGKLNALQSGVADTQAAGSTPDFWLFTDADIRHDPENVRELVAWAVRERLDLASLMVQLHCDPENPWERLLVPAFVYFFMLLYPFGWARDPQRRVAAAAGGCVLISDAALARIGGLASIASRIIDDCSLAANVKAAGGRIDLRLTGHAESLRPYGSLGGIWGMVKRSAFTQLGESYPMVALTVAGMALLYAVPPVALAAGVSRRKPWTALWGAAAWGLMAATYKPTVRMYKLRPADALTLPLAAVLYTAMTVDSALAHARKRGGGWKGRTYGAGG
jgi:hopene-associated glycosyltransferase HpnB